MRKMFLFVAAVWFFNTANAQNAEVVNAYNYLNYNELDKAKIAIDKAITDPKTGISAKTWYYRGIIYQSIYESPDASVKAIDSEALQKSYESYLKSMEYDTKKAYLQDIKKRIPYISNHYVNKGIEAFKAKNFDVATTDFETAAFIGEKYLNRLDTPLIYNASLAAQNAKNTAKSKELLNRLIELKYPEPEVYRSLATIYFSEKDTVKGLSIIDMGKKLFPTNNNLMIDELNIYMAQGQSKQMIDKMEEAAAADPTNKSLCFALGATYDNMGNKTKAEDAYKKALEIDPNYFDALYNLGALHYNIAVETFNKTNNLPVNKQKEYEAGKVKYTEEFNKALPYLEKALQIQPEDKNTLLSLREIYAKTDNYTKATEMKKRLEALK